MLIFIHHYEMHNSIFFLLKIYKGLDIITNKVTTEERAQCAHHMLDFLSPLTSNYTVVQFRDHALPIVSLAHESHPSDLLVHWALYFSNVSPSFSWRILMDHMV